MQIVNQVKSNLSVSFFPPFPGVQFSHDSIFLNWSIKKEFGKIIVLGVINDSLTYTSKGCLYFKVENKTGKYLASVRT